MRSFGSVVFFLFILLALVLTFMFVFFFLLTLFLLAFRVFLFVFVLLVFFYLLFLLFFSWRVLGWTVIVVCRFIANRQIWEGFLVLCFFCLLLDAFPYVSCWWNTSPVSDVLVKLSSEIVTTWVVSGSYTGVRTGSTLFGWAFPELMPTLLEHLIEHTHGSKFQGKKYDLISKLLDEPFSYLMEVMRSNKWVSIILVGSGKWTFW